MKVRLRIDGVDRSALLPRTGWTLEDSEGKRISTLSLPLEDRTGALAASALELKEVILDDPDAPSTRYFLGLVTQVDTRPFEGVGLKHDIVCQEYGWLMEHYFHTEKYTAQTDAAIIADAFAADPPLDPGLAEIDATTLVQASPTNIGAFTMNNMSLRAMMDALSLISSYIWYVDWNKKLVYQPATYAVSALILSDDGLNTNYRNLARTKDYTGIVTTVRIRGGQTLSAVTSPPLIGNNDGAKIVTSAMGITTGPTDAQPLPTIWVNTGTDGTPVWSSRTVGSFTKNQSLSDFQTLFDWINSEIHWVTAPPNFTNSYRIEGRIRQQFTYDYTDQASKDIAGRDIIQVINEPDIITQAQAVEKGRAIIREKGIAREKVTLFVNADGLRSGQLIKLVNSKMGIDKFYSIRRIVTRFLGAALASYELTLTNPAKLNPDVLEMIAAGWKAANPSQPYRDSEIIVISINFTETALSLAEDVLEAFSSSPFYRVISNPISVWPFEEGQGATGDDRYGSNDLTLTGSPTWVQGKKGYALQLDGSTQYGTKTSAAGLPTTAMTVACWIKLDMLASYRVILEHDKDSDGGWNLNVDSDGALNFTVKDGVSYLTGTKSGIVINTWYHVVGVYDGSNVKVYIDGVVGTDAALVGKTLDSVGTLSLGADAAPANYFDGLIDELWLFPVALPVAEIETLRDFKEIWAGFWKVTA